MTTLHYYLVALVAVIAIVLVAVGASRKRSLTPFAVFVTATVTLAAIRLGAFWYLYYLERTGQQTYSAMPLILLCLPEGFVLPNDPNWLKIGNGVSFSLVLVAGCAVVGAIAGLTTFSVNAGRRE